MIDGLTKMVTIFVSKCAITGPPEIGKTCLKALLLGMERPTPDHSTPLLTTAEEILPDVQDISAMNPQRTGFLDCFNAQEIGGDYKWGKISRQSWARLIANTIHHKSSDFGASTTSTIQADTSQSNSVQMKGLCKMILNQLKRIPAIAGKRRTMEKIHLIYLVDTGGQPQFQEILPNFIQSSVNILVHKLSGDLSKCPEFSYNGVRYGITDSMKVTNLQIIEQSVRSVCSTIRTTDKTNEVKPSIAIVGTFEDKFKENFPVNRRTEELMKRSKEILSHLDYFYSETKTCELLSYGRNDQIIYPIDGSEQGWGNNNKVIDALKGKIQENTGIELTIPVWYMAFLQDIKASNAKNYITLKECCKIAENCGLNLSSEDIQEALKTFHEMNVILYFPESLKDLVFVEPSYLYQIVTDIIVTSFNSHELGRAFNTTGIMTKDFLKNIPSFQSLKGAFTQDSFLILLKDLLIIADLGNHKYFMPCVLPLHNTSEMGLSIVNNSEIEGPLVISFGDKLSPRGLFCSIIVELQQCYGWTLIEGNNIQKRNKIEFHVTSSVDSDRQLLGTAIIIDKVNYLEVHTTCLQNDCVLVQHAIRNCLFKACHKMKYSTLDLGIELGLYCNSKQCAGRPPHHTTCWYDHDHQRKWVENCKSRKSHSTPLGPKRAVWFSKQDLGKCINLVFIKGS